MSRKRTVVIAVLLGVVVLGGLGAAGLWQYHEQPQFCATCHLMDPYLESWQSSDYGAAGHAAQGVTCLDCHEPTVRQQIDELMVYVQGEYTVPLEERDFGNEFCFDCHETTQHTSYEEVIQLTAGLEINPHDSHLGEMECSTCHKMHGPSGDYCAQCHGAVATGLGWTTEVTATAEVEVWAPDMDCTTCHVMDPYFESLQDSTLLASAHAQQGLECVDCHDPVELQTIHEQAVAGRPVTERTVDMQFCFDCHVTNEHTSYEEIIGRTADYVIDGKNINPHDPHAGVEPIENELEPLGPYECRICHQMHTESPLIDGCYGCHMSGTLDSCYRAGCHVPGGPSLSED